MRIAIFFILTLATIAFSAHARREAAPEQLTLALNPDVDINNHYGPFALVNEVSVIPAAHCFCNPYKWETAPPFYGQWVATCVANGSVFYSYGAGSSSDFCSYCPPLPC